MYYHVKLTTYSKQPPEVKLDLSESELQSRILLPYEEGKPIVISGRILQISDIKRINITVTEEPSSKIRPIVRAELEASNVLIIGISEEEHIADKGKDITDQFILGPPGTKKVREKVVSHTVSTKIQNNRVFIVHGHDENLKNQIETFLGKIGLDPIILHRQPDRGLTLIEKLETYSNVTFAFILLTPDDIAYPSKDESKKEEDRKKEYRARQNVIFEFGYFAGKLGREHVCCLYKAGVTIPTDVSGLIYKKISENIEQLGYEIIKELKAVGLDVKV